MGLIPNPAADLKDKAAEAHCDLVAIKEEMQRHTQLLVRIAEALERQSI